MKRVRERSGVPMNTLEQLNDRSRTIFRAVVESYLDSGEPVGSRTVSRKSGIDLSPASIRNVMGDLEDSGLIYSPHTSAGRLPTELGLRLFVDGLLEVGDLTEEERTNIDMQCSAKGRRREEVLGEAINMLSGLCHCAGLVTAPKTDTAVAHVEFVPLSPDRALAVLVTEDGTVENRVLELPAGMPSSSLTQATNYLNARFRGRSFDEARGIIETELAEQRSELDSLASKLVEQGLAVWSGEEEPALIVRGRANLLEDLAAAEDLERVRKLFEELDSKQDLVRILESVRDAEGVKIFIGSENSLFSLSGSSLVVSPYMKGDNKIVGAIGVIGPTRINYARIIPMVDYTAKVVGRLL